MSIGIFYLLKKQQQIFDIIVFTQIFFFLCVFFIVYLLLYLFFFSSSFNKYWSFIFFSSFKTICYIFVIFLSIFSFFYTLYIYIGYFNNLNLISSSLSEEYFNFFNSSIDFYLFSSNILKISITKFSLLFFLLFSILYPIILLMLGYDYNFTNYRFYISMLLIFIFSYFLIIIDNIVLFYFIYEIILILVFSAMYLSSNSRGGIEALLFFAGWAILGSILVGFGFILLISLTNSYNFSEIYFNKLTINETFYIYLLFFFGFGTKLSIWPFWYWLPRAHVEVSTGMSIFLSCILIKLSYFCLFRIKFILMTEISYNICIIVTLIGVIDIVFRIINLRDLKAIIAYSSVLHTNLLLTLVHLDTFYIVNNSILYIWGHSLATASIFIAINLIESRYGSRNIIIISGLWYTSPLIALLTFWSILSFLDLPITLFFWGELWLWIILISSIPILGFQVLILSGFFFVVIFFKIWWNILFGMPDKSVKLINNINIYEIILILFWLIIIQLILGIQPSILTTFAGYIV